MSDPAHVLGVRLRAALVAAFGQDYADVDPLIRRSDFADYQANVALSLAKRLHRSPRQVADALLAEFDVSDLCEPVEVSGPGFLNLRLRQDWIAAQLQQVLADERLGVPEQPATVIPIDYSSPNVAKEMHVAHLRTTVVGDALARTLEHLGHNVIRQNHVGDWGTAFGMLIEHLLDIGPESPQAELAESDPNAFYQAARTDFDASAEFADRSRSRVVALQAGDPTTLAIWRDLIARSVRYFNRVYATLDVTLTDADLEGESTYNDELAGICDELEQRGIAVHSDGALCVFPPGFTGREGKPVPLIIRKRDGGYGYATTDLATIRHRVRDLRAQRILYVVGASQHLHFELAWAVARLAGWLPDDVEVVHVQIGNVLGGDGKLLRTRSGDAVRLLVLLDEAVERAAAVVEQARPELDDAVRSLIGRQVGIGAVKYADLSVAHDSEYTFDFDRMLALQGNTGPYLQYAAARIRSIFRRDWSEPETADGPIALGEPAERRLGLALLGFGPVVTQVGDTLEPHRLCGYLFDLAQSFTAFYERCPVLNTEDDDVRRSRLALSALTLRVLVQGLDLLGVSAPEQM